MVRRVDRALKKAKRGRPLGSASPHSCEQQEPWKAFGMSRSTYFRRLAGRIRSDENGRVAEMIDRMREALKSAKANILDHQGCIMPPHLMDAVVREIDEALGEKMGK